MRQLVVDLETLGNDIRSGVILSIGAVSFDFRDETLLLPPTDCYDHCINNLNYFYTVVTRQSQVIEYGWTIEADTLEWWTATAEKRELLYRLFTNPHALDIERAFGAFEAWVERNKDLSLDREVQLWSHGVTYDCMHLSEKWPTILYQPFTKVVPFRKMRDTRTLFDLYEAKTKQKFPYTPSPLKHHALDDAYYTACSIHMAWETLTKGDDQHGKS